jgi:oligosaccharide repeat unit polymerase
MNDLEMAVKLVAAALVLYMLIFKGFDYLDPLVGYLIPWLVILYFSTTRLSRYAISIHFETYALILLAFIGSLFVAGGNVRNLTVIEDWKKPSNLKISHGTVFLLIDVFFLMFTVANILVAGYIPLFRGMSGESTNYLDFGIRGVYGFYLALANALCLVNFIIFIRTGKRIYIFRYIFIMAIFVLLVTRQNLISVAVECVIAYSLIRKRIKWRTIVLGGAVAGILFSIIGSFRSGSIRDIAGIESKYQWVPEPVIWLYAYSYFNIANMDNLITQSDAPYYDASSLSTLIPSFLRPEYNRDSYLLVNNFNVSSYMFPVYEDAGRLGVLFLTVIALRLSSKKYQGLGRYASIGDVGTYCVLYFCATFSFFFNFWFFLPVISQIVFLKMLSNVSELACTPSKGSFHALSATNLGMKGVSS